MISHDNDGIEVYSHGSEQHKLLLTKTPTLLRASMPPISDLLGDMPQSEYQVKIYRSVLDVNNFTLNQRSHGSCFPRGTNVRMADGTECPIESIRPLDSVLTAEGNVGRVLSVMARDEKESLACIHLCGHKHLCSTPEHPILTKRGYVAASELKIGDWVAIPRYMPTFTSIIQTSEHIRPTRWMVRGPRSAKLNAGPSKAMCIPVTVTEPPDVLRLTAGVGRIFGLFLAEGNTDKTRVVWTFNIDETETLVSDLISLLKTEFGVEAHKQYRRGSKAIKVVVYGTLWAQLFESLCSTGSGNKKLHKELLSAPRDFQESMLQGWLDGDGYRRRTTTGGVTVSHNLALAMFDIANAVGRRPTIRYSEPKISHTVKSRQPRWDIEWGDNARGEMDEKHVWRKVQGVLLKSFNGPVYNLHVEGDNSYVAEGIGVHNCVGFATAAAAMKVRFGMGQTFQRLSGSFVYSFINGGRDQGASIGEALDVARNGICLESEADWDAIYPSRIPSSARETAKRFQAEEIYRVDTWSECCSALQMGFAVVYAVMVGGSFDRLDSDGVIGLDRGPGNHAVHAFGMTKSAGGVWLAEGFNSWGPTWGDQGRFRSGQRHWESVQQDAFAFRVVKWDPQDPNQPPTAR